MVHEVLQRPSWMRRLEYDRYGLGETGEGTGLVAEL